MRTARIKSFFGGNPSAAAESSGPNLLTVTVTVSDAAGRVDFVQPPREERLQFCKNLVDQPRHWESGGICSLDPA